MPNELSEKVYPDGTVVKLRDDTAREQISELNTISSKHTITTTTSGVTITRGEYYTLGKIVFVSLDVSSTVNGAIATLPKPVSQVNVLNCDLANSNGAYFEVTTNGQLSIVRGSSASVRCIANLIYLSNDV